MRPDERFWIPLAAALLASACAATGSEETRRPPPAFTRAWSPYTPEQLNRDVVDCAEESRNELTPADGAPPPAAEELRRALHERIAACMRQRGWKELRT
jgi:uncharacterized protein (DUF849 family)